MSNPYRAIYEIDTGETKLSLRFNLAALVELHSKLGDEPVKWMNDHVPSGEKAEVQALKEATPKEVDAILRAGLHGGGLDEAEGMEALSALSYIELRAHALAGMMTGLVRRKLPGEPTKNAEAPAGATPASPKD